MRLFGWPFLSGKNAAREEKGLQAMTPPDRLGGWWGVIRESFSGAWQQNVEVRVDTVLTYSAVFACISLIAADVGKLRPMLVAQDGDGIWSETTSAAFSPVLRKPNHYQNRIQFIEHWITSKLVHGNAYILKRRDGRGVVVALYVLDPTRVTPLVATDGSIYYRLKRDDLSELAENEVTVPASEMIHDRFNCLYHPLIGLSPLTACGLAAVQGLKIQKNSALFFGQNSIPGGLLTAPAKIDDATAGRLKAYWEENFTGGNVGKIAVLGDNLKFEHLAMKAVDAQLIEQLKWTAETVCSTFHVPAYKVNVGAPPAYNNIEALDQQYYSQCLQTLIEALELCLDEGLALPDKFGTELDLDGLFRMDTATMIKAEVEAVAGGIKAPNEARRRLNLKPVPGGATPYMQQQNYSLAALDKRDKAEPFKPAVTPPPAPPEAANDEAAKAEVGKMMAALRKRLA